MIAPAMMMTAVSCRRCQLLGHMSHPQYPPDSATVTSPSVITGDLPRGWILFNSGGASIFDVLSYRLTSYCTPSSSKSQMILCERELLKWCTTIIAPFECQPSLMLDSRKCTGGTLCSREKVPEQWRAQLESFALWICSTHIAAKS